MKYFDKVGKNMSFKIEDDDVLVKYNNIWNKIKHILSMKFHSKAVYDQEYIKAKVKTFNSIVNTIFWDDEIPKENVHYTYIAVITFDSAIKVDIKNYPQVYLEEYTNGIKKKKMTAFIVVELDLDDSDHFDSE